MKSGRMAILICAAVFLSVSNLWSDEILTNETVITLIKSDIGEELVVSKIKASECQFDTSTEEIVRLKSEGVSESIMQGMIECTDKQKVRINSQRSQDETDYQTAVELIKSGKYSDATDILNRLATEGSDIKYHLALIDAMIERVRNLRKEKNDAWETKAYEVQRRIKDIYQNNKSIDNPDYWLLHAKFSGLVRKAYKADGAIDKALFFRPGYIKAYIVKGDIYFHLANDASDDKDKQRYGETSRSAYRIALESIDITPEERALIYYRLGDLEHKVLGDFSNAVKYWKEAVSYPESVWGKFASERLADFNK